MRPALRWSLVAALLLAALLAVLGAGIAWSIRSEGGTAWLLARVPGLTVQVPRGALLDGDFAAQRVQWRGGDGTLIVIDRLAWEGLRVARADTPSHWLRLSFAKLSARRVSVQPGPGPKEKQPAREPGDLGMPFALRADALAIDELRLPALGDTPLLGITARLPLGDAQGAPHRIERLHAQWDRVQGDATLQLATRKPFALQASVQLRPATGSAPTLPWQATLDARGPLSQLQLTAALRGTAPAGKPAPALDAQATLTPFAAWPIAALSARTQALDLSSLASGLPSTAIFGDATIRSEALNRPIAVALRLDNHGAGLWNEGKLPLRRLVTELGVRLDASSGVQVRSFDIELGSAQQ